MANTTACTRYDEILSSYNVSAYDSEKKQSHVAFLLNGKKVVAVGYNQYHRNSFNGCRISSLHAEIDCIRQLKGIFSKEKT